LYHGAEGFWSFFAKNLLKFEKRWIKTGKNGEIIGRDESL
jgi:hypothetical protein